MIYDINSWCYQRYMKWNAGYAKPDDFGIDDACLAGSYWSGNVD